MKVAIAIILSVISAGMVGLGIAWVNTKIVKDEFNLRNVIDDLWETMRFIGVGGFCILEFMIFLAAFFIPLKYFLG